MGAELEKGRNLLAETSGGQIRKGPKPLATSYSYLYATNFCFNVQVYTEFITKIEGLCLYDTPYLLLIIVYDHVSC